MNLIKKYKMVIALTLLVTGMFLFAGCAGEESASSDSAGKGKIVIGSKNYSENILLGEIMAQLIEDKMDVEVERKFNLGGTMVCFQALKNGQLDLYADFTGTGLLAILKKPLETDPDKVYEIVQKEYNEKYKIKWLKPIGFNNTYAIAVRQDTAEKHNLETVSDLAGVSDKLVFGSDQEFINRKDGLKGLKETYGLEFKDEVAMETALKYQAIENKKIDVTDAFSTDGELLKYKLKILKDDKSFFPPYYCAPTVRMDTLEKYPKLEEVLNLLGGKINEDKMQQLNYQVVVENKSKEEVARTFLKETGLVN